MNRDTKLLVEFVEQDFGISSNGGNYIRAVDHDSLVIDVQNGIFFWNSKGIFGNPIDYLTKVRHMRYTDALELEKISVGKTPVYSENSYASVKPFLDLVYVFHKDTDTYEKRKYWYDRGISDTTIEKFKLGHMFGWFTVPIMKDGNLLNIQLRRDTPQKRIIPYYRSRPYLFNSDILEDSENVIICEGIVDAMLLQQFGFPSISKLGGAYTWQPEWFSEFFNKKKIYLVFDNDKAGRGGAIKVANNLGVERCRIYTFDGYPEKYDIIDFFRDGNSLDKFIKHLKKDSKYAFEIKDRK